MANATSNLGGSNGSSSPTTHPIPQNSSFSAPTFPSASSTNATSGKISFANQLQHQQQQASKTSIDFILHGSDALTSKLSSGNHSNHVNNNNQQHHSSINHPNQQNHHRPDCFKQELDSAFAKYGGPAQVLMSQRLFFSVFFNCQLNPQCILEFHASTGESRVFAMNQEFAALLGHKGRPHSSSSSSSSSSSTSSVPASSTSSEDDLDAEAAAFCGADILSDPQSIQKLVNLLPLLDECRRYPLQKARPAQLVFRRFDRSFVPLLVFVQKIPMPIFQDEEAAASSSYLLLEFRSSTFDEEVSSSSSSSYHQKNSATASSSYPQHTHSLHPPSQIPMQGAYQQHQHQQQQQQQQQQQYHFSPQQPQQIAHERSPTPRAGMIPVMPVPHHLTHNGTLENNSNYVTQQQQQMNPSTYAPQQQQHQQQQQQLYPTNLYQSSQQPIRKQISSNPSPTQWTHHHHHHQQQQQNQNIFPGQFQPYNVFNNPISNGGSTAAAATTTTTSSNGGYNPTYIARPIPQQQGFGKSIY